MAHPVIDDSKTWTYLLEHKPPALRGFINNHPQQFELEREVRKFTDRTTGAVSGSIGNTNFKSQVKIILGFWHGDPRWREAYRFDIALKIDNGEYRDWFNLRLATERPMNADTLGRDVERRSTASTPLFDGI